LGWHTGLLTGSPRCIITTHLRIPPQIFANHNTFNRGRANLNLEGISWWEADVRAMHGGNPGFRKSGEQGSPTAGFVSSEHGSPRRMFAWCHSGASAVLIMERVPEGYHLAGSRARRISRRRRFPWRRRWRISRWWKSRRRRSPVIRFIHRKQELI